MADNDSNIIKPVESLQNIASLTPVERRKERKRKQQFNQAKEHKHDIEKNTEIIIDEELPLDMNESENECSNPDGIDFCA